MMLTKKNAGESSALEALHEAAGRPKVTFDVDEDDIADGHGWSDDA